MDVTKTIRVRCSRRDPQGVLLDEVVTFDDIKRAGVEYGTLTLYNAHDMPVHMFAPRMRSELAVAE